MLIAVAVWWLIVFVAKVPAYLLPAPDAIASRFVFLARSAELAEHIRVTLSEIAIGFGIGGLLGVALGWMFVHVPRLGRLLSPLICSYRRRRRSQSHRYCSFGSASTWAQK